MQGYFAEQDEGSIPKGALDPPEQPEERLAFALGDGRVGVLAVKGRKVVFHTVLSALSLHTSSVQLWPDHMLLFANGPTSQSHSFPQPYTSICFVFCVFCMMAMCGHRILHDGNAEQSVSHCQVSHAHTH